MDEKDKKELETLERLIVSSMKITDTTSVFSVFSKTQEIISYITYLSPKMIGYESMYRVKYVSFIEEGDSVAKAEAKAKASSEYKTWKRYEAAINNGYEQINILKKFQDKLSSEQNLYNAK